MANTSNLGLAKLDGTEKLKTFPNTFNSDIDTIDTVVGNDVGTSRTISQAITRTEEGIAIVANGNTHSAISSGQYVYVKNHGSLAEGLYIASSNISANATLSGSNLTAVSGGGLNSVYSALNSNIASIRKLKYMDLNDTTPMNVQSKSAGTIGYNNFVGCSCKTNGVMALPYLNSSIVYIKLVNYSDMSPYSGAVDVRVWYV